MKREHAPLLYQLSSLFLALAGLMLIGGTSLNLFGPEAAIMVSIGSIILLVSLLLMSGRRWLAYIAFLAALICSVAAYLASGGTAQPTEWTFLGISAFSGCSAAVLFVILWRKKRIKAD